MENRGHWVGLAAEDAVAIPSALVGTAVASTVVLGAVVARVVVARVAAEGDPAPAAVASAAPPTDSAFEKLEASVSAPKRPGLVLSLLCKNQ